MADAGSNHWPLACFAGGIAASLLPLLARGWIWLESLGPIAVLPAAAMTLAKVSVDGDRRRSDGTRFSAATLCPALAGLATRTLALELAWTGHRGRFSLCREAVAGLVVPALYLIFFGIAL
ncbi:MAG: hypothetical protein AAGC92_05410 [Pseudomonadota bacterium]